MTVPRFVYLAASDGEEAFWAQLLMIVMLAAGGGIYAFIKTRPKSRRSRWPISIHRKIFNRGIDGVSRLIKTACKQIPLRRPILPQNTGGYPVIKQMPEINYQTPAIVETVLRTEAKRRDLKSGMELLSGSFLVKVIESRNDEIQADRVDIEMQKMCFAEMKRRNELEAVSSEALKAYTVDEAGNYGKTIHRQAMEELFRRTGPQNS